MTLTPTLTLILALTLTHPCPLSHRVYQPESLDLLYRHYYREFRHG